MRWRLAFALLLVPSWALAAPPDVPGELKVKPGQLVRVRVKTEAEVGTARNFTDTEAFWGELVSPKGERHFVFQAPAEGKRTVYVVAWWTKGETEGATTTIVVDAAPPAPPPQPKPDDPPAPKPVDPVTSFRVIFAFESGDLLPPGQRGAVYGKAVEDWLTANCTGGAKGWRRRDKDSPGESDPEFVAMWAAAQASKVGTPFVAVERNGRVIIAAVESSPAKMVESLKSLKEGK